MKGKLLGLGLGCGFGIQLIAQDVRQSAPPRSAATAGGEGPTVRAVQNSPRPEPALPALLKLFDKYQVVGLSDLHGCAELLAFVETLVQSPEFAAKVNDITWEPGNARFQSLMDDFILQGKEVPLKELSQCWRNNTQAHTYSDTPALFHLLDTIRSVNLKLPEPRRIRVLLIDPPVDWSRIQSRADIRAKDFDRETHMAEVLEREVYAKGRKALFFAGGAHLWRGGAAAGAAAGPRDSGDGPVLVPFDRGDVPKKGGGSGGSAAPVEDVIASPDRADPNRERALRAPAQLPLDATASKPNVSKPPSLQRDAGISSPRELSGPLQTLERRHPGTTFNIAIHEGFGDRTDELEARFDSWPRPALAPIRGTWWGELSPPPSGDVMIRRDGKPVQPTKSRKIQDSWDAVLFLGKRKELTRVDPPGPDVLDTEWMNELRRRKAIFGGPGGGLEMKESPHSRRYFSEEPPQADRITRPPAGLGAPLKLLPSQR